MGDSCSWIDKLTEEDMRAFTIRDTLRTYLKLAEKELGIHKQHMKVLDYGCGRGRAVLLLRENGYCAYGVDTDQRCLENGYDLLKERLPRDQKDFLTLVREDGTTSFPDEAFDFVFSEQVFEHVQDLDKVASEINRVSKSGSIGLHCFPAHRRVVEGHFFMPFIHWLPKGKIRKYYIYILVLLGFRPSFPDIKGKKIREKAEYYYVGSVTNTFYRSYRNIQRCFERHGFDVDFATITNKRLNSMFLFRMLKRFALFRLLISWMLHNFVGVVLVTTKTRAVSKDHS